MRSLSNNQEIRQTLKEILQRREFQENKTNGFWQQIMDKISHWLDSQSGGKTDFSVWKWLGKLIEVLGYPAFFILVVLLIMFIGYGIFKLCKIINTSDSDKRIRTKAKMVNKSPGEMRIEADAESRAGNYKGALRLYYQAMLLELDQKRFIVYRAYKTNREYIREINQKFPSKSSSFRQFLNLFEVIWYGGKSCTQKDLVLGISLLASIREESGDEK